MLSDLLKEVLDTINKRLSRDEKDPIFYSEEGIKNVLRRKKYRTTMREGEGGILEILDSHNEGIDGRKLVAEYARDVHEETLKIQKQFFVDAGIIEIAVVDGEETFIITEEGKKYIDDEKRKDGTEDLD